MEDSGPLVVKKVVPDGGLDSLSEADILTLPAVLESDTNEVPEGSIESDPLIDVIDIVPPVDVGVTGVG